MNLGSKIVEIQASFLKDALEQDEVILIDVREQIEHAEERIEKSHLIPLSRFDSAKIAELVGDKKLVLHCRSGKRSLQAAEQLIKSGFQEVHNLSGGIEAWKSAGLPTLRTADTPISLIRQVHIAAGVLILLGVILSKLSSPNFIYLSAFVGAGLVFSGITNTCAMGMFLARMPWNQVFCKENSSDSIR